MAGDENGDNVFCIGSKRFTKCCACLLYRVWALHAGRVRLEGVWL